MNGAAPVNDYSSLMELAGRIHKHLATHPRDRQALDDLHYVVSQLQGGATQAANDQGMADATGPQTNHPGAAIGAGLTQAAVDIPKSILQAVTHPIRTAGQVTGIGNIGQLLAALKDPEASTPEKLDALARATPLNMGYATERGLLNTTGAKADTPASLQDQAHAAGNVASLALLGVNRNTPGVRLAGRVVGKLPVIGPLTRAAGDVLKKYGAPSENPQAVIQREMAANARPELPPQPASVSAVRLHETGKISAAEMSRRLGLALGQEPGLLQPSPLSPMPGQPQGLLGPEGISPPPKASYPPTISEMQGLSTAPRGKPGHPLWQGEGSPTRSPAVRQGEPLTPSKNDVRYPEPTPQAANILKRQSFAKLKAALDNPQTPDAVKQMILGEFQRRGIFSSPGLLAP